MKPMLARKGRESGRNVKREGESARVSGEAGWRTQGPFHGASLDSVAVG